MSLWHNQADDAAESNQPRPSGKLPAGVGMDVIPALWGLESGAKSDSVKPAHGHLPADERQTEEEKEQTGRDEKDGEDEHSVG
jgi:hypothetical protein